MASAENINVEMSIEAADSVADDAPVLLRLRRHLNPGRHTVMENALAAVVILLFLIIVALAATHAGVGTQERLSAVCEADSCLYRAAYLVSLTNRSVNPCEDFFQYACGAAKLVLPIDPTLRERTVVGELTRGNEDKLEAILRSRTARDTPNSYERKLKTFFAKCVDDFLIERVRGSVLAMLLRPDFCVMNASAADRFDLDRMLLSVVQTFGAQALFQYKVEPNQMDGSKYTISISNGGIGMLPVMYLLEFYNKQREAYRTYISTVAQLLVTDAESGSVQAGSDVRIGEFVLDVMEIETELANISFTAAIADPSKPPLDPANQVSLIDMDRLYQPVKWTNLFIQLLRPNAQETTKVAVLEADYLGRVMMFVKEKLPILHPTEYKRKLSNYMNWQIIRAFTGDLSSAYIHAMREFESTLSSSSYIYESRFDYCFDRAKRFMLRGLSSLFVADHLVDQSRNAVDNMYKALKTELISGIDRLDWMEPAAREKAKVKARAIVDKIGYSSREIEDTYLDTYYQNFRVDSGDYLLDMSISWQTFNQLNQGTLLGTQLMKTEWTGATFSVSIGMSQSVELTIPAGILQWPLFSQQLPGFINYATIAHRITTELIKSIDATGQLTDQSGTVNPMWSAQTLLNYAQRATCVNKTFSGLRAGPYIVGNRTYYVDIDPVIARTLRQVIAETDALRLAARVYTGGQAAAAELPLPLGHLDKTQAFFVSWAQTFCYTRDPLYSYIRGFLLRSMPEEIHVNGILSIIPEFGQSFRCPSDSKMVSKQGGCDCIFYK